jgi:hypothetical protein
MQSVTRGLARRSLCNETFLALALLTKLPTCQFSRPIASNAITMEFRSSTRARARGYPRQFVTILDRQSASPPSFRCPGVPVLRTAPAAEPAD